MKIGRIPYINYDGDFATWETGQLGPFPNALTKAAEPPEGGEGAEKQRDRMQPFC